MGEGLEGTAWDWGVVSLKPFRKLIVRGMLLHSFTLFYALLTVARSHTRHPLRGV